MAERRIEDTDSAVALLAPRFAGLDHEELRVILLDGGLRLIKLAELGRGSCGAVVLPFRALIREALATETRALIVAHNHPSGDPRPSAADHSLTKRLVEIARLLQIRVLDHLIFADDQIVSFRALGLL